MSYKMQTDDGLKDSGVGDMAARIQQAPEWMMDAIENLEADEWMKPTEAEYAVMLEAQQMWREPGQHLREVVCKLIERPGARGRAAVFVMRYAPHRAESP